MKKTAEKSPKIHGISNEYILHCYRLMYTARQIDERAGRYIRKGMGWSYHARCAGHEGIQIALGVSFKAQKDFLFPYYRDTATVLAGGLTPLELMLNGLSRHSDVASGGRHMSNHFAKPFMGIQNVSSSTGNHTLHAVGLARAIQYYGTEGIVFSSQGEASTSEGYCYEAYNGASRERLPVIFVIQNNGYGISVPLSQQTANACVSDNFIGLKYLHIIRCDGTDLFDSTRAMQEAMAYVRSGEGPVMIDAACVRIGAHSNSDAQELYRSAQELAQAQARDPLVRLRAFISNNALLDENALKFLEENINEEMDMAAKQAENDPLPSANSVQDFVVGPAYVPLMPEEAMKVEKEGVQERLREAINRTLIEEFERNPHTFLWGQDVASKEKGGVFNLTKGLLQRFGEKRIFNAPLCEDFIVGTANGMSRFRPDIRIVIEAAQFADYVWPAMEQIVEMGHEYWRTKGQFCPNVVLRLPCGGYIQGGLYHSQNVEAIMAHLPGVRVVYPAFAEDAAGLLRTAIRSEGMTFFMEPKSLYNKPQARGPQYGSEFAIPFGKGKVRKTGTDAGIITYGNTLHMALEVAGRLEQEDWHVEVFDLRSIKPLDIEGICACVRRSGKTLVLHEDYLFSGIGAEVVAVIMEHCFADLDAPVVRLGAQDIPIGFAAPLERAILPQVETIEVALRKLLQF